MGLDEKETSATIAMWYRKKPIQVEVLKAFEGNITIECHKYLLGKMCIAVKAKRSKDERVEEIYNEIGSHFGYAYRTLKRFVSYAIAIDLINKKHPHIAADTLNGKSRLGIDDTIALSKKGPTDICVIFERVSCEKTPVLTIFDEQLVLNAKSKRRPGRPRKKVDTPARISVKDTPTYSPDAQVNALSYTIPSWVSMVEKTFTHSDFSEISLSARGRLNEELNRLISTAESVMALLVEVN